MLDRFRRWACPDLAIDLGTVNTLVAVPGEGIVVNEPSVVALQKGTRRVLGQGTAVGKLARQMLGRTPDSIVAARPLQDGVITDFELCEAMMRYFMRKASRQRRGLRPRVVIAVPAGITPVERRAVFNSAERAGAKRVCDSRTNCRLYRCRTAHRGTDGQHDLRHWRRNNRSRRDEPVRHRGGNVA